MKKKTHNVLGQLQTFIITSCKKIVPKFIHMKNVFWGKNHIVLF
jgi:hypothetical protein